MIQHFQPHQQHICPPLESKYLPTERNTPHTHTHTQNGGLGDLGIKM